MFVGSCKVGDIRPFSQLLQTPGMQPHLCQRCRHTAQCSSVNWVCPNCGGYCASDSTLPMPNPSASSGLPGLGSGTRILDGPIVTGPAGQQSQQSQQQRRSPGIGTQQQQNYYQPSPQQRDQRYETVSLAPAAASTMQSTRSPQNLQQQQPPLQQQQQRSGLAKFIGKR